MVSRLCKIESARGHTDLYKPSREYVCLFTLHYISAYNHSFVEHIVKVFFRLTRLHIFFFFFFISDVEANYIFCSILSSLSLSLSFPPSSLTQLHTPRLSKKQAGCRLSLLSAPSVMQYGPLA